MTVITVLCISCFSSSAQYYYKDIITNDQVAADMATYKAKKINNVRLKSFEDDGSPSQGFYCERKISKDFKKTELLTKSAISGSSVFNSFFNDKGKLSKTIDSSSLATSVNTFIYDNTDRVVNIISTIRSADDDFINEIREEHLYYYNEAGIPSKMVLVKNRKDSTTFLFMADEKNNVSIEKNTKTGSKYYYYYDDKNRLTDVVHTNDRTQKLLPDYMFQYDNSGLLTQMTATEEGGSYYYIWRYSYENGLRSKEQCYSKEKRLMGSIEYGYK
jgi:hypothetical protein